MRNNLIYLALIVFLISGCEDIYTPEIEVVPARLVVESHITNDLSQNFVRLSMSRDFYNFDTPETVKGAKVELLESGGTLLQGIETGDGYFTFLTAPAVGKKYTLRIKHQQDSYESDPVIMPPLPQIDSLYTKHKIEKSYRTDSYGIPNLVETPSREILIDAPISAQLSYYRFYYHAIIQWTYNPPSVFGPPPPSWYGWKSVYDIGAFNLAGPKEFSVSEKISTHPVLSLSYNGNQYLDSVTQLPSGWIVILDEYGLQKESYDFHARLNSQFSAEGSLFDPMFTQVYGNIHCTTDHSKIVLGFFDLNSYRQYRYFFNNLSKNDNSVIQRQLFTYPEIPSDGYLIGQYPSFWEFNYSK